MASSIGSIAYSRSCAVVLGLRIAPQPFTQEKQPVCYPQAKLGRSVRSNNLSCFLIRTGLQIQSRMTIAAKVASAPEQREFDGQPFPLVLSPDGSQESPPALDATLLWVKNHIQFVEDSLLQHGAILFRGWVPNDPEAFDHFVTALGWERLPYVGGAAVRKKVVGDRVVTTNESPPDQLIPFHHEMAQVPVYPHKLFFFCQIPASQGGETPLALSTVVYDRLKAQHPDFVAALEAQGVRYVRVMSAEDDPGSAIGRGWKSTLGAATPEEAEAKLKEMGSSWEWLGGTVGGDLKTMSRVMDAVKTDPRTGKKVFFNQIVAAYTGWKDVRNIPEQAVMFGGEGFQGSQFLDVAGMAAAVQIMDDAAVAIKWEAGDIILVDNILAMHARRSFVPPRVILATLIK
eukprot:jgi/Mesvir1/18977/Mv18942-RA.1